MQRTVLNRHRRGYATEEAATGVHFPVLGPIGLARSQVLIYIIMFIIITFSGNTSFKVLKASVKSTRLLPVL